MLCYKTLIQFDCILFFTCIWCSYYSNVCLVSAYTLQTKSSQFCSVVGESYIFYIFVSKNVKCTKIYHLFLVASMPIEIFISEFLNTSNLKFVYGDFVLFLILMCYECVWVKHITFTICHVYNLWFNQ